MSKIFKEHKFDISTDYSMHVDATSGRAKGGNTMKKIATVITGSILALAVSAGGVLAASEYQTPIEALAALTGKDQATIQEEIAKPNTNCVTIAEEAGVLDQFANEVKAIREDNVQGRVANGTLTQERADQIMKRIDENENVLGRGRGDGNGTGTGQQNGNGTANGTGNGAGQQNGNGTGTCNAPNFVDEDGDGVCDNLGARPQDGTGQKNGNGTGQQNGNGTGIGNAANFVDEDGDGVLTI